jgi:hypothetical protein
MSRPTVVFNGLTPVTRHNICANCEGMVNKICTQITTLDVVNVSLNVKAENFSSLNRSDRSVATSKFK